MPHNAGISPQLNPKARDRSCSPPNLNRDNTELTDVTVVSGFHAAKRRRRDVDGNHQVIADSARKKQASHTSLSDLVDVASLAVPSLGAVLADPLISLVDTACVGQVSSLQLASLGPNTAIFNLIFQVSCAQTSIVALFPCFYAYGRQRAHFCGPGVCIPECYNHKCFGHKLNSSTRHIRQGA